MLYITMSKVFKINDLDFIVTNSNWLYIREYEHQLDILDLYWIDRSFLNNYHTYYWDLMWGDDKSNREITEHILSRVFKSIDLQELLIKNVEDIQQYVVFRIKDLCNDFWLLFDYEFDYKWVYRKKSDMIKIFDSRFMALKDEEWFDLCDWRLLNRNVCCWHFYFICKKSHKICGVDDALELYEWTNFWISKEWYFKFVKSYDYRPRNPKFLVKSENSNTFWIELEYNFARKKWNRNVYNKSKFLYAKHDWSLEDWIEFVSYPFDMDWYLENRNQIAQFINNIDWETGDWTWLHVHVWRQTLSSKQIENMVYLINHNHYEWSLLSWRRSDRRAWFYKDNNKHDTIMRRSWNNKYSAINLCPRQTVEIRTFRNSKKAYQTLWRIELVMALVDYCKKDWQRNGFLKHCKAMIKKNNLVNLDLLIKEKLDNRNWVKNDKRYGWVECEEVNRDNRNIFGEWIWRTIDQQITHIQNVYWTDF